MNKPEATQILSEEERKKFKEEIMPLLEKRSKDEIEMVLRQLKKKVV